jgi:hypothetical protein
MAAILRYPDRLLIYRPTTCYRALDHGTPDILCHQAWQKSWLSTVQRIEMDIDKPRATDHDYEAVP